MRRSRPRPTKWSSKVKRLLTQAPWSYSHTLDLVNQLGKLNTWRRQLPAIPYFDQRDELYSWLSTDLIGNKPITYLEFGVYQGASLRSWTSLNTNPASTFVGFDTFEGLPTDWPVYLGTLARGHFTTDGRTPELNDPRVGYVKGVFQDTLPRFLADFQPQGQLVINNDSDLYTSTLYTLCHLDKWLSGAILVFDEFTHVLDEFRALEDYTQSYGRPYTVLGAAGQYYDRVAVRFGETRTPTLR